MIIFVIFFLFNTYVPFLTTLKIGRSFKYKGSGTNVNDYSKNFKIEINFLTLRFNKKNNNELINNRIQLNLLNTVLNETQSTGAIINKQAALICRYKLILKC